MPAREAWGLDLGQTALHAVKVRRLKGGAAEIADIYFHSFGTEPDDPDLDAKVEEALQAFVSSKNVRRTPVVASLPAFTTIFRDFPLPAVSDSRLDEIVSYEAKQIIPFPLDETVWDYQKVRTDEDTGEIGIALICCRRDIIEGVLGTLDEAGLEVDALQVAPLGLVNYVQFERPTDQVTLLLDAGARGTDFIILNDESFWFRPLGVSGTDLTKALMQKFSIPYDEAESLKCKLGDSKQADRVFRVVEPTLRSLVGDVQRSIGYYKSMFRGVQVQETLCAGNTFLLSGADRFLADNLGMPVHRMSPPENFEIGEGVEAKELTANRQVLGIAAGLALQGVGLASVDMTLLPPERRREKLIRSKRKYAVGAILLAALAVGLNLAYSGSRAGDYAGLLKSIDAVEAQKRKREKDFENITKRFPDEEGKSRALANVAPTRGYLLTASAAVMHVVDRQSEMGRREAEAQRQAEAERLFQAKRAEWEIDDEELLQILRKRVDWRTQWRFDRYKKVFLDVQEYNVEKALYRPEAEEADGRREEDATPPRLVFDRLEGEEPADRRDRRTRDRRYVRDEGRGRSDEEEDLSDRTVVHVVQVKLAGFIVSDTRRDATRLKERLEALDGVVRDEGAPFEFTVKTGTVVNPETNPIRLPMVEKPEREAFETALRAAEDERPDRLGERAFPRERAAETTGEAKEDTMTFETVQETVVRFDATFLYRPGDWTPPDLEAEEDAPDAR